MKTNNFRFAQIVDFFSKYSGAEYIKPEKAGAEKEYKETLYKQGSEARKNFINFAKKLHILVPKQSNFPRLLYAP